MTGYLKLVAVGLVVLCLGSPLRADDAFRPKPVELDANDLAEALGLRCWKYRLQFPQPVSSVSIALYELKHKGQGGWQRERLSVDSGYEAHDEKFREATVTIVVPEGKAP